MDMGELGLQELLHRFDRLDKAVDENVERVADHVIQLGTKVDDIVESTARLEGTLEAHINSEDMWRREVSEKINAVDYQAKANTKEIEERIMKVAGEAKTLAETASQAKNDWGVRWQTVVALVAFVGAIAGAMAAYSKLSEPRHIPVTVQSPARPSR